jgi:ribosomal protein S18 acetylase RimI-like enzyme
MSHLSLLRTLEENAHAASLEGRDAVRVGPFLALLHRTTDVIWLNHAMPVEPVAFGAPFEAWCRELRALFQSRDRALRFEFFGDLWPTLGPALEAFGLTLQARQPLMMATPEAMLPNVGGAVRVEILTASSKDAWLRAAYDVAMEGFGESLGPFDAEATRAQLAAGSQVVAVGFLGEEPVSCGTHTPTGAITEMVGVATVPRARRKGAAHAVCAALTRHWFEGGGKVVWLSAGDDAARRLYESLGFQVLGELLNYIDARGGPL